MDSSIGRHRSQLRFFCIQNIGPFDRDQEKLLYTALFLMGSVTLLLKFCVRHYRSSNLRNPNISVQDYLFIYRMWTNFVPVL